jgi:hypothetical protein
VRRNIAHQAGEHKMKVYVAKPLDLSQQLILPALTLLQGLQEKSVTDEPAGTSIRSNSSSTNTPYLS